MWYELTLALAHKAHSKLRLPDRLRPTGAMVPAAILALVLLSSVVLGDVCPPASNATGKLHFRVSTLLRPPYMMQDDSNTYAFAYHQNGYTGFLVELLNELFTRMDATFEINLVADGKYGFVNDDTKTGVGIVGDVFHCRADLGAIDLVAHSGRLSYIALTLPYQQTGYAILLPRTTVSPSQGLFALFDPFDVATWIVILVACAVVFLCLALIYFISPYGAAAGQMTRATGQSAGPQSMPLNAGWWAFSTLVRQRPESMPFTSGRILIGGWFFVTLVFISVYVANFAAFRIVGTAQTDLPKINTLADLVDQTTLDYGAPGWLADSVTGIESTRDEVKKGGWFVEQKKSALDAMAKMADYVHEHPNNQYGFDEGVSRVRSQSNFAYVSEYHPLLYSASLEPCNTRLVGRTFSVRQLSLALPKGMPYEETINHNLLDMKLEGWMEESERRWFNLGPCDDSDVETESLRGVDSGAQALGMKEMGGIFILLAITTILALAVAAFEKAFVDKTPSE